jgi:hypothetical protein
VAGRGEEFAVHHGLIIGDSPQHSSVAEYWGEVATVFVSHAEKKRLSTGDCLDLSNHTCQLKADGRTAVNFGGMESHSFGEL